MGEMREKGERGIDSGLTLKFGCVGVQNSRLLLESEASLRSNFLK